MKENIHSSGFKKLDNLIDGFVNGELVLIGGRPIADVTQLLINVAITFSRDASVFYFAPSYLQSGIINRMTSLLSQIPMNRFVQKEFKASDTTRIAGLHQSSAFSRIHLHDSDTDPLAVLKALQQTLIEKHKIKCVIIDDLQALCHSMIISSFIQELKRITEGFEVTIIMATELNRAIDTRRDKKPRVNDLPKCKFLQELSDKIILVDRPGYYNKKGEIASSLVEIIVVKNINGDTGTVQLRIDEARTNIVDPIGAM